MEQLNVYQLYDLGKAIHPLTEMTPGDQFHEYVIDLTNASVELDLLINGNVIPIEICKPIATRLLEELNKLLDRKRNPDWERVTSSYTLSSVRHYAKEFETVFAAEVQNLATYSVSKKGIYDTNDLIARADEIFPDSIRRQISEQTKRDFREAGRCLAFDLATAAGFHIARAVEGTVIDYLEVLCPQVMSSLRDNQRNLGAYIRLAKENGGDERVCSSLDQFRDLHRNPLIHPESTLTTEEATMLMGIAQSAMSFIVLDIQKRKR